MKNEPQVLTHPFPALCDGESKVLILGSFPSVKSREQNFFYGHPQNRFWKVMATLCGEPTPRTVPEKSEMLLRRGIALWDVIASCEIVGSSDSSIKNAIPNDLRPILASTKIRRIYCNGNTSFSLYEKYIRPALGIEAKKLPSTSPANAAWSFDALCDAWRAVYEDENKEQENEI